MIVPTMPTRAKPAESTVEYTLVRELGRGATAVVSLARCSDGRRVVVKALRGDPLPCAAILRRFCLEAEVMRRLRHPNVMPIIDVRADVQPPFFVMPLLDGAPLRAALKHVARPLPVTRVVGILRDLARALRAVHHQGLAHRDLKPDNVFVTKAGVAILFDFGLVKETVAVSDDPLTRAGELLGTPCYMSPEQIRGLEVTAATDVYAFGVVATELLLGTNPFFSKNVVETIRWHLERVPDLLEQVAPHRVSAELSRLVAGCLEKAPDDRPTSVDLVERMEEVCARVAGGGRRDTGVSSLPATRATHAPRPPAGQRRFAATLLSAPAALANPSTRGA